MNTYDEIMYDNKLTIKDKIVEKIQKKNMELSYSESTMKCDHCEIGDVLEKNRLLETKYNETFDSLNKVRAIVLEVSEQLLEKEFRITHLEKNLHDSEKKVSQYEERLNEMSERMCQLKMEMKDENAILENQIRRMTEIVREKDAKILSMNKDNLRIALEMKEMKRKNTELMAQLETTCDNLNTIVRETNEREKMLNNLETELKNKQIERQKLYLNEINRNKRLFINIKAKENMMGQIIQDKNTQINERTKEIKILRDKLDRITTAFSEIALNGYEDSKHVLAISNSTKSKVECTVTTPCDMKMLNGTAKITI
ncbi:hypothetical protein MACK_003556 [Theileria orientalis]|uniref:Uncharacterized protein n=1 Tax=Theileria orientalis TaxID=68886 RepID=A0A976XIS4_THEOR|nr:hypothetical protein MACK_003556 [Theileria orientalis]